MTESQLQRALVEHLHLRCTTPCWFAVPNGGKRGLVTAVNLKRQGVRAGVADLIFLKDGKAYALELKTERGRATSAQIEFMENWIDQGGFAIGAYGLDAALHWLKKLDLIK